MKSILYVGATLMIGASVYGFVDYRQTSHKKEFKDMYAEGSKTAPDVNIPVVKKADPVPVKTDVSNDRSVAKKTKTVSRKADVAREETLPAIRPIAEEDKLNPEDKVIEKTTVNVTPSKESSTVKKSHKRKLNTRLFSRGALDERYVDREDPPLKEAKRTEKKEQ